MAVQAPGANSAVTGAIRQASRITGTNFQYLLATAQVESRLNPAAAASTSSARGLFQFIEQTWLTTLKEQGAALGYGDIANVIERTSSGHYVVPDRRLNERIMRLRSDPHMNAAMAAAYTKANAAKLAGRLGRNPTEGELYVAHFLGPNGASRLISLAEARPGLRASEAFPGPARANPSIFYDRAGRARSVADVYRALINRYQVARGAADNPDASQVAAAPAPQTAAVAVPMPVPAPTRTAVTAPTRVAAAAPTPLPVPAPARVAAQATVAAVNSSLSPDPMALAQTYSVAASLSAPPKQIADAPVFHGLFRTSERREAVAPVVSALWSAPTPVTDASAPQATTKTAAAPEPTVNTLSLFQDQMPDARGLFRGRV